MQRKSSPTSSRLDLPSSLIITFNSSSFLDYHHTDLLNFPLRLSVRFRTIGRISNGVLLSLTHRQSDKLITPFVIIEHSHGKIEITILQLDERLGLSTVTVGRHEDALICVRARGEIYQVLFFPVSQGHRFLVLSNQSDCIDI
jgi:hypothetical protein